MKASDVRKVERKLGITLPGPYLQFLLDYAAVRDTWRGKESARPFPHKIMFLPDELIDANIEFRANPTKLVAPNFLQIGFRLQTSDFRVTVGQENRGRARKGTVEYT